MNLPVAILAGGLATRLHPLTKSTPKSLIQVAGDFFIAHQLRYLQQQGLSEVVLCVSHLGEQIKALIGDGSLYGLNVRYAWDGSQLLGTGGAIKQALPLLGENFFVMYGDSYLPIDFKAVETYFFQHKARALMTIYRNNNQWDKSNVLLSNNRIVEYNKQDPNPCMQHIDYGLSVFSASVFNEIALPTAFDLGHLCHILSLRAELMAYPTDARFYEVGSFSGLKELTTLFARLER